MNKEISANYMCYCTVKELWDSRIEMYYDLSDYSQMYDLQQKIGEVWQQEDSATKYFNTLKDP